METKRRKQTLDLQIYSQVPPHAIELEKAILGALLLENKAFDTLLEVFKAPDIFYSDANQRIFKAMLSLQAKGLPIDCLMLVEQLKKAEDLERVGGYFYLTQLTDAVVSSANIRQHARVIFEKFVKRKIIQAGGEMVNEAYDETTDAFEVMDKAEKHLYGITNDLYSRKERSLPDMYIETVQELEIRRNKQEDLSGVPTGFPSLDHLTNGWQPTDLIVLAARPSVGKTALCLQLARNAACNRVKPTGVLVFSLEMSAKQLMNRLLSSETEIPLEKFMKGRLTDQDMEKINTTFSENLFSRKLFIDDTPAMNIFEMRAKARRMKNAHGIGLIIVDYLQLMNGTGLEKSREQEISTISRNLKALAKELEVPIIALSQLSREVEKRSGNKMPVLSDLRESGAIEQDADAVIFIYRPEYHNIHHNSVGEATAGETHLRWAKHRNGSCETLKLKANLTIQKFTELQPDYKQKQVFDGKLAASGHSLPTFEYQTDEADPF